jgi:hypothetical protein
MPYAARLPSWNGLFEDLLGDRLVYKIALEAKCKRLRRSLSSRS